MEKTIKLGDKEILLKATAMNLLIYQEEFGEDIFKAKGELLDAMGKDGIEFNKIPSLTLLKMLWTMARTGDKSFPPFNEWVDSLEELPMVELYTENINLFLANMVTKSDIKN